jgi:signal transduction histidine kinase
MFQKLLLIIAIPLAAQAIFISMLLGAQAESARAQSWAVHSKEVIAKVEEIYRILLEANTISGAVPTPDSEAGAAVPRELERVPVEIARLRAFVADNPRQQARIDELAAGAQAFLSLLAAPAQSPAPGAGAPAPAFDRWQEGIRLLAEIRTTINGILAEETDLDRARLGRVRGSRAEGLSLIAVGGAAVLAATIVLALFLFNNISRRLGVLRENTQRLASGLGLAAPLDGRDEIAEVDRAFHEMAANLEQQKQENEMFVYSVSHDLRSPLINLQGFSEELSRSYRQLQGLIDGAAVPPALVREVKTVLAQDIDASIRYIQVAVGRLARIIDAMLRLSRAGRVEYQWQWVDVGAHLSKITAALADTIARKNARVSVGDVPPAWGDPTAVEQIFANLVANAVQYLDPARSGEVEVGYTGGESAPGPGSPNVYYVKDNGLGIAPAYHPKVFAAFSRLHAKIDQGEGVGLALVHRMVERHGGKIWMQSEVGAGTTFFVALPSRPPEGSRPREAERSLPANGHKGGRAECQPNPS